MLINLNFKKFLIKTITLVMVLFFALSPICYGFTALRPSLSPVVKKEIFAALQRTQIRYAESEDALRLLAANNADCLILSSGKYLVTKEVAQDDLRLLRAIIHEDIEAIMQILAKEDRYKYQGIKELVLKYFPPTKDNNLPIDLYVNHTIARAFEWLLLVEDGILLKDEIPLQESNFINAVKPIIMANKHSYFNGDFLDSKQRGEKIRLALNNGMRFYQVASSQKNTFPGKAYIEDFLKQKPPMPWYFEGIPFPSPGNDHVTFYNECKEQEMKAEEYLNSAYKMASFLNKKQAAVLKEHLDAIEKSAKDFDYNAGGGHYGYVSYSALRDLIQRVRRRLVSANVYTITLDDIKHSDQAGNKANSFILFKKLNLAYPDGIAIPAPIVKSILAGDNDVLNAVIDQIMQHFLKEKPGDEDRIFLSVRSSPQRSMPGRLKTWLHVECERWKLTTAIKEVASSWNNSDAVTYRQHNGIFDDFQMGIIVQKMVLGFRGDNSCAGVVFSRDPNTGKNGIFGSYLHKGSCDAIVSGERKGDPIDNMAQRFPDQYKTLQKALGDLENESGYPQEVEFTVESGALYFLQTRDMRLDPKIEAEVLAEFSANPISIPRIIDLQERAKRRKIYGIDDAQHLPQPSFVSPLYVSGTIVGRAAFSVEKAREWSMQGDDIVLVATKKMGNVPYLMPYINNMGLITIFGDASSHDAVMARGECIPAVINPNDVQIINSSLCYQGRAMLKDGDEVAICNGKVYTEPSAINAIRKHMVEVDIVDFSPYRVDALKLREDIRARYIIGGEWKVTHEELLALNATKYAEFKMYENQGQQEAMYRANLEKHILHELLLERSRDKGDSKTEIETTKRDHRSVMKKRDQKRTRQKLPLSIETKKLIDEYKSLIKKLQYEKKNAHFSFFADWATYEWIQGGGLEELHNEHDSVLASLKRVESIIYTLNKPHLIELRETVEYFAKVGDVIMDIPGGHRLYGEPSLQETLVYYEDVRKLANRILVQIRTALGKQSDARQSASGETRAISRKALSYDTAENMVLLSDLLYSQLHENRFYDVKYDTSRLSPSQIEIIEEYIKLLRARSSNPNGITLRPFSSNYGSGESLIAVYCRGRDFKGEGHVDVSIQEGELKDYVLRITGMINIALASSNIPDNLLKEDVDKYRPLMSYIKNQYKSILGEELAIPDSPEDILKVIRRIVLDLPKSIRITIDQIEEYNRLTKEALTAA